MEEEGEDPPTPRELERKHRSAMRLVRLKRQQQRMRPMSRRAVMSVEDRAARCLAASAKKVAGTSASDATASGAGGATPGDATASGAGVAPTSGCGGAPASEASIPPSRMETEAGMRRVMAEEYLPEQSTPDNSELLFPIQEPVPDYNPSPRAK